MTGESMVPWIGSTGVAIPASVSKPGEIVPYAVGLRPAERERVVQAFEIGLYEMGAEFVWRRAITRLRQTISALGMSFIGEMLNRDDVDDFSSPESVLTDYDAIRLAEALGVVNATGALKLRHALELIAHYSSDVAQEDLPLTDAVSVIRSCVQFALGEENIQVAVDFSRFRDRLLSETISPVDPQLEQFGSQPPFFVSTALRVLLAAIKSEQGARLQHVLSNLTSLLPLAWQRLPESDKWSVGGAYAESAASGKEGIVAELKRALLKVGGFDYVPENLRSSTYRRAAQAVTTAHFSFNNYEGEIKPTQYLASLGSAIPKPALPECVRALLLVYVGNPYGFSFAAAPMALQELRRIAPAYWQYYFSVALLSDADVLETLTHAKPAARFVGLLPEIKVPRDVVYPGNVQKLLEAAEKKLDAGVQNQAKRILAEFKPLPGFSG